MFLDESDNNIKIKISKYLFQEKYSIDHFIFKYDLIEKKRTVYFDEKIIEIIKQKNDKPIDTFEDISFNRIKVDDLNFEDCGFDVTFKSKYILNDFDYLSYAVEKDIEKDLLYSEYILCYYDDFDDSINDIRQGNYFIIRYVVEIKPTIGDDYPAILRQIKKQQNLFKQKYKTIDYETILLTEEINVKYLSEQKVIDFFKNENIMVYKI